MHNPLDLNGVALFVKIAETGSFSGAARLLGLPKTTVSSRFAALEASLQTSLIQRTTRKLHLTAAGERFLARCAVAMRALDDGTAELNASKEVLQGVLRVTAPTDMAHTLLPAIVQAFVVQHPGVTVELLVSNAVADLVAEGIDLAVRTGSLKDSSLVSRRFFELRANLWATPGYLQQMGSPAEPADLAACEFVLFGETKTVELQRIGKAGKAIAIPASGRVRVNDLETVKSMLLLGRAIGWLPDFVAADAARRGLLVPVLSGWRARSAGPVHFVYPGHKYTSPTVRAFIKMALAHVKP